MWIYASAAYVGARNPGASGIIQTPIASWVFLAGAIVPFCEAIMCNRGFKDFGGHALFDLTIAVATTINVATDAGPSESQVKEKKN